MSHSFLRLFHFPSYSSSHPRTTRRRRPSPPSTLILLSTLLFFQAKSTKALPPGPFDILSEYNTSTLFSTSATEDDPSRALSAGLYLPDFTEDLFQDDWRDDVELFDPTGLAASALISNSTSSTDDGSAPGLALAASSDSCEEVPADFKGPEDGFAQACKGTRYCSPAATTKALWEGPDGDVSRAEIESLLGLVQGVPAVRSVGTGNGNILSSGVFGMTAGAAGLGFEMTGDLRWLDQMVRTADNMLYLRNDPNTGRLMWTGKRELVWPTTCGRQGGYAGCEGLMVIGHMVNTAIAIFKTPCLQDLVPTTISPDSPSMFSAKTTYRERALEYVKAADETVKSYYLPLFLDRDDLIIQPNDPKWDAVDSQPSGQYMPYNRRFFMLHGFVKLALAHQLSPSLYSRSDSDSLQDEVFADRMLNIVKVNTNQFVGNLRPIRAQNWDPTYIWKYGAFDGAGGNRTEEAATGIHGLMDMWGMWMVWQAGVFTDEHVMTALGNAPNSVWSFGNGSFSAYVDGTTKWPAPGTERVTRVTTNSCTGEEQNSTSNPFRHIPQDRLAGQISFFTRFVPDLYQTYTAANSLRASYSAPSICGPLLWTKFARSQGTESFWIGRFSRNDTVEAAVQAEPRKGAAARIKLGTAEVVGLTSAVIMGLMVVIW